MGCPTDPPMNRACLVIAFLGGPDQRAAVEPNGTELACAPVPLEAGTRWLHRELSMSYTIPNNAFGLETSLREIELASGRARLSGTQRATTPKDGPCTHVQRPSR